MQHTTTANSQPAAKVEAPTDEQIRARAYEIYLQRGQVGGHDMDDWLQAEYELLQLPVSKLADLGSAPKRSRKSRQLAVVSLVEAAIVLAGSFRL